MGLQRCAQYNKENVEKLARVLVGLSMLNETAYAEEIKSAGENSMEWWKAAEQSVAMRALSDDEIEERMTHDEL
ncbi:hypothetical protein Pmar_PMAR011911 [Perkinsus marinus ATCC 50983]|uniref:Uncharacterized protein n=1 Tax=Perkinsus marinus (strain ATCC 50983 / TXsc) TaxID=423536 RepID=C5LBN7_PERM5|nr:hypothetical protein Pmar_PMAR011911 [Perkinsus marinus ATCC 50983]EER05858.1 hypothetical protein Pmar_PMAR011911 [Perkinsus marinus ATCC 50983]|eukprot:XP_002774042.1 hypothetical protein Pmar_PMAR011911 [Perkinsus marinus ATCC 50983]